MKKAYLLLVFAFCSLSADVNSNYFSSLGYTFKDITSYSKSGNNYQISYSATVPITSNLRFYFPKNTKIYNVTFLREYSRGAIYSYISLGALPNYINKQSPYIYPIPENLSSLNISFSSQDAMSILANPSNTIFYAGTTSLITEGSTRNQFDNAGKWFYVRQDDRQIMKNGSQRSLTRVVNSVYLQLDKAKVDQDAELIGLEKFSECQNKGDLRHICTFIRAHGANGSDANFNTHSQTSEGLNENLVPTTPVTKNINSNWSIIGPHSMSAYSLNKNFPDNQTNIQAIQYFISSADPYWENWTRSNGNNFYSVAPKKAMFVYANASSVASFFEPQSYSQPSSLTLNLVNGWNLVSTDRALTINSSTQISTCVDAMYKISNSAPSGLSWDTYDKAKQDTDFNLAKNDGFWIKTNKACTITLQ